MKNLALMTAFNTI